MSDVLGYHTMTKTHLTKDGSVYIRHRNIQALATDLTKIKNESISFLGSKIWNIFPDEIKQQTSLNSFKKSFENWKPQDCSCRLCKVYITGVSFPFTVVTTVKRFIVCFFYPTDTELFTFSTLISEMT